ncbi:hypothetical protein ACIQUL_29630 [Streptomyces sp. NPDC090303]|uniref:hypothetical protein n=1 Tax=Streptomyces sp. NPDC090303 TaxID=3365960 RepID=UPI003817A4C2
MYRGEGQTENTEEDVRVYPSDSDTDDSGDESEEEWLRFAEGRPVTAREIPMGCLDAPTELYDSWQGLCSGDMGACNTVVVAWDWREGITPGGAPYGYFRHMRGAHGAGGMPNVNFQALFQGVPVASSMTYVLKASDSVGSGLDHDAFLEGARSVGLDPTGAGVLVARGLGACYTVLRDGTVHLGRIEGVPYAASAGRGVTDALVLGYGTP